MLAEVRQATIRPVIEASVARGARVHTDEYGVYARLEAWGYEHKAVCHGRGEYARDEDGDGFCEVHVNTLEGSVSLADRRVLPRLRGTRGATARDLPSHGLFGVFHTLAEPNLVAQLLNRFRRVG